MTVVSTYITRAKPGRTEEAVDGIRRAAKPLERLGARNIRLLQGVIAAENFGQLVVITEYESNEAYGEAYGEAYDRMMTDDELVSIMAAVDAESSPLLSPGSVIGTDIPLGCPDGQGSLVHTTLTRPAPGRFADAIEVSKQFGAIFTRLGAAGAKLTWLGIAGSLSGTLAFTLEYANAAVMGRCGDAFLRDSEARALLDSMSGPDAPSAILSQDVYAVIPL